MANPSTTSYDSLRDSADKGWTLAGDDQVLRLMMKIGKNLEKRTVTVTEQIDQMLVNVDRTCIQLENVNNKLVALQKTHFFDHQIQDDEEYLRPAASSSSTDTVDKGRLSKANAEEVLKKVLKDTVNAVDKCYEKIVLDWSDSILDEDDDVIGRTMIRPMDLYKDMPRPYLIGSDKWKKSKFVGLNEEEEGKEEVQSTAQWSETSQEDRIPQRDTMESGSTSSSEKFKDDTILPPEPIPEPAMYSERFFKPPDLSSDLRQIPSERMQKPDPEVNPSQITSPSVFFDETPPVPQLSSISAIRKKPNLFADLEDDDDDDGVFSTPTQSVQKALPRGFKPQANLFDDEPPQMDDRITVPPPKSRNVFDDNVDGDMGQSKGHSTIHGKKQINLFDDDAIEDDLFAPVISPKKNISKPVVTPKEVKTSLTNRNEDFANNNSHTEETLKKPINPPLDENRNPVLKSSQNDTFKQSMEEMLRKGIGGGGNKSRPTSVNKDIVQEEISKAPVETVIKAKAPEVVKKELPKLFDPPTLSSSVKSNPVVPPVEQVKHAKPKMPRGLFDDLDDEDMEDDLFSSMAKQGSAGRQPQQVITKEVPKVNKTNPIKSKSLFDDDDTESEDLFGPTPSHLISSTVDKVVPKKDDPVKDLKSVASKYKSRGLFDDDDSEEEDLFKPKISQITVPKKEESVLNKPGPSIAPSKSSLFGEDDEEEDLFASKAFQNKATLPPLAKPLKKASLFHDSGDDDDLFGPKTTTKVNESKLIEEQKRMEEIEKAKKANEEALKKEQEIRKAFEEQAKLEKDRQEQAKLSKEKEEQEKLLKLKEQEEEIKRVHENERKRLAEQERENKVLQDQEKQKKEKEYAERQKEIERLRILEEQKLQRILEEERQKKVLQDQEQEKINKAAEEELKKKLQDEENRKSAEEERQRLAREREINEIEEKRKEEEEQSKAQLKAQEQSKKSSLFDDLEEEDDLFEDKPPVDSFSPSVALFDEPPEDNHYNPTTTNVHKTSHFEEGGESSEDDSLFSSKKPNPVAQPSSVKKSIDLFSDLPPEDDEEDLFSSTQKPTSSVTQKKDVFYDDMAESFPPTPALPANDIKTEKESMSSSMFDNVPEDDMDDVFAKESPVKVIKKSETVQSVRDLIKSHETPVEPTTDLFVPRKSLPNKLNSNLVINVSAILPGARPPSLAKRMSMDSFEDVGKVDNNEVTPEKPMNDTSQSIGVSTPIDHNKSDNSAVLSSLNKSRPKVGSNRRPSTRKGRQESLRRSQLFDSEEVPENDVPEDDVKSPVDKKTEDVNSLDVKKETITDPVPVVTDKKPNEVFKQEKKEPAIVKLPKKTQKLFDSDEEYDSDDLFKPKAVTPKVVEVPKKDVIKKEAPKIKQSSLFSDDGDSDDDLFGSSSSNVTTAKSTSSAAKSAVKKEAPRTSTDHNPLADLF